MFHLYLWLATSEIALSAVTSEATWERYHQLEDIIYIDTGREDVNQYNNNNNNNNNNNFKRNILARAKIREDILRTELFWRNAGPSKNVSSNLIISISAIWPWRWMSSKYHFKAGVL